MWMTRTDTGGARVEAVLDQLFGNRAEVDNNLAGLKLVNLNLTG